MRVISVDLGLARTGIAAGDTAFCFASPITVINEYNEEKLIDKIWQTAKAENAEKIVVGLPKNILLPKVFLINENKTETSFSKILIDTSSMEV